MSLASKLFFRPSPLSNAFPRWIPAPVVSNGAGSNREDTECDEHGRLLTPRPKLEGIVFDDSFPMGNSQPSCIKY